MCPLIVRRAAFWCFLATSTLAGATTAARGELPRSLPVVAPPTGSYLPPRPTLYVFWPWYLAAGPKISAETPDGRPLPFREDTATESRAFRTYRVSVGSTEGSFYLVVNRLRFAYTIDPAWKAPRAREVTVAEKYHENHRQLCYGEVAVFVAPSVDAPTYRLEWAPTAADYRAGRRQKIIFPRSMGHVEAPELGLGVIGCVGQTLPPTGDPVYIGVAALYPDGSRIPASARPTEVKVRVPVGDGPATFAAIPRDVADSVRWLTLQLLVAWEPPRPPPTEPRSVWMKAALIRIGTERAAIAGLVVLLLAAVWHRLRGR